MYLSTSVPLAYRKGCKLQPASIFSNASMYTREERLEGANASDFQSLGESELRGQTPITKGTSGRLPMQLNSTQVHGSNSIPGNIKKF